MIRRMIWHLKDAKEPTTKKVFSLFFPFWFFLLFFGLLELQQANKLDGDLAADHGTVSAVLVGGDRGRADAKRVAAEVLQKLTDRVIHARRPPGCSGAHPGGRHGVAPAEWPGGPRQEPRTPPSAAPRTRRRSARSSGGPPACEPLGSCR